jgi:hypothetical protein
MRAHQDPRRRGRGAHLTRTLAIASAIAALLFATAPTEAAHRAHVTHGDRVATRTYLQALLAYEQAQVTGAPASQAAFEKYANDLAAECPGVLAGAPHEGAVLAELESEEHLTPRQRGERNRETRQSIALETELFFALGQAEGEPTRQAALAFVGAVKPLHWSNPDATAYAQISVLDLELDLKTPRPAVCADMRAWVASAYKSLPPGTKLLQRETEAVASSIIATARRNPGGFGGDPLKRYEGPYEQMLERRGHALVRKLATRLERSLSSFETLLRTLGLQSAAESEAYEQPRKGSVEIGHGRTLTGASYEVYVEPPPPGAGARGSSACPITVGIYEKETRKAGSGQVLAVGGGSSETCLSRKRPMPPLVNCSPEGVIDIEAQTLPRTRRVRLLLSDGREVTSSVAVIPARLGGPTGLYYQHVRGPSPVPVSLTELDTHGKAVRTIELPHTRRCAKRSFPPPKVKSRTIARGRLPQGTRFSIVGERTTFMGHSNTQLRTEVAEPLGGLSLLGSASESASAPPRHSPFALQLNTGCEPHEYAIVYGVLKSPRDVVLVRVAGKLEPLRRVRIPAILHVHGVLAYAAVPAVPEELLVRAPSGRTVATQKLTGRARMIRETCEGEAEPA